VRCSTAGASPRGPEAQIAVFDYIEGWYNPRHGHSALDYLSPMAYENRELVPA
jgi:transposase InsO family protein